ncbi:MAG: hypothetical protein LBQ21_07535 [Clostridiales Family XIII bacterium]|jgi:hypothetical protein|nr:hypothetical protein [Clostridiales Family XIII bacterium]
MKLRKEITKAGQTYFIRIFGARKSRPPGMKREKRCRPTCEQVRHLNALRAERYFQMLLNHNFRDGDYHLTLTYEVVPTVDQARKNIEKFQRRLRSLYRRRGVLLRWVSVTEYQRNRIHHHMVITGGVSLEDIKAIWPDGFIFDRRLHTHGDYRDLASYLLKETRHHLPAEGVPSNRRYGYSRTIVKPETRREDVNLSEMDTPKVPKGYYLDEETKFEGLNPVTERPFVEYVLLPLAPEADLKKWKRLKRTRPKPDGYQAWLRDHAEYQLQMPTDCGGLYDD